MKRKILAFGIILCMLIGLAVMPVGATVVNSGTCGDNLAWTLDNEGTLTISGTGDMTMPNGFLYSSCSSIKTVVIQDGVTSIDDCAFAHCSSLNSVTIPDSVTSIRSAAFSYCSNLTSIIIPDGVSSIGSGAFENCSKLTSITIPDSVISIREYAFCNCSSLTSITIPDSVISIGRGAFTGTAWYNNQPDGLLYAGKVAYEYKGTMPQNTSIVLKDDTKGIADNAFTNCSKLTSITIPDSMISIGSGAFENCSKLTSITIPDGVSSVGSGAFTGTAWYNNQPDGLLYAGKVAYEYKGTMPQNTSIVLKDDTKGIADNAFTNCSSLISIIIPDSVISIERRAFENCSKLTSIIIPDGVSSIERRTFCNCSSLTSITIPDSVTSIGGEAFYGCSNLTSIIIPDSVSSIGDSAFENCSKLTSITIPDSVSIIEWKTFCNCSSLTSITIPDSVSSIAYGAFTGTAWYNNQPDGLLYAGKVAYEYKGTMPQNTSIVLKDDTKGIADNAFTDCSSLISITIPDSVISIGVNAFINCSSLKSITIPDSVTSIEWGTFTDCSSLISITIPDCVTSIRDYAFCCCSSLKNITIPYSVKIIDMGAFDRCNSLTDVYYGGSESDWNNISIVSDDNDVLKNATMHYNKEILSHVQDYEGNKLTIPENGVLDIGENLYFRNGYVDASNGYIKTGDRKITGSNIYFTSEGKIRLDDGENAKIVRDNGNGTTDQGFVFGKYNPSGVIIVTLDAAGTANDTDYTGKTIQKEFNFTGSEIYGLTNFGFAINRIPKPIEFTVRAE